MNLLSGKLLIAVVLLAVFTIHSGRSQEIETLNKYRRLKLAEDYYEIGLSAFEDNEFQSARENLEKSVQLDPNNHLAYYFLGSSYERIGSEEKALLNYTLAISLKPEFSEAIFSRATMYYKLKRYQESLKDFNLLLDLPPGETQAVYFRGINYGEDDSVTGFEEIISMTRNKSDIHQYLGQIYKEMNEYQKAIGHYSAAIQQQPGNDNYYVNRGITYADYGEKDSARLDYIKALDINPDNSMAKLNLALLSDDEMSFSLESLNDFITRNPNLAIGYANRAYYYFNKNLFRKAIKDYDSAISLDPENPDYYIDRGMTYEKLEEFKSAMNNYNIAAGLNPDDPRIWNQKGNVFYKLEEFSKSIEHYTRAITLNPSSGNTHYNRGLAYFYLNKIENACSDMKKAYSLKIEKAADFLNSNCH